ncbi:FxLYD domain-containing protein [Geomonas azotofigens]|uniref:FxLYD domain-containing protein n=1 Tax=Geomonas azotofigens TaxID=2843196 RepID=UPI001C10198C|nr:FxLYD domain-containing protein [Geomonas azotofigens]MBU5614563.1 FxLYD domain-containing protein [Geomonas azotofigens]
MRRVGPILLILFLCLGACASFPDPQQQRLAALPQHYKQFDVLMGYEVRPADGSTVVQGIVKNVRYFRMRDLEIWAAHLDARGKVLAQGMTFIMPSELGLDQSADFTIKIPEAVPPGDRIRITYKYFGSDGGTHGLGDGTNWMQSFETAAPAR